MPCGRNIEIPFVPRGAVYRDLEDKLRLEARNGVIQAEFILYTAQHWATGKLVDPSLLLELQELAVNQIFRCAGHFRDGPVSIQGAEHAPPDHTEVVGLVEEMCGYLNSNWGTKPPVHLSAYAMWRLNWIHPFFGGNGRTSRAFSYLVLCIKLGFVLPAGEKNIPELIVENRDPYYQALRDADKNAACGRIDVSKMEDLLASLLAAQLVAFHEKATGKPSGL